MARLLLFLLLTLSRTTSASDSGDNEDVISSLRETFRKDRVNVFEIKDQNLVYMFIGDKSFLVEAVNTLKKEFNVDKLYCTDSTLDTFQSVRNTGNVALFIVDKVHLVNRSSRASLGALDYLHAFTDSVAECHSCITTLLWETSDEDRDTLSTLETSTELRQYIQPLWTSENTAYNGDALLGRVSRFLNYAKPGHINTFDSDRENICSLVSLTTTRNSTTTKFLNGNLTTVIAVVVLLLILCFYSGQRSTAREHKSEPTGGSPPSSPFNNIQGGYVSKNQKPYAENRDEIGPFTTSRPTRISTPPLEDSEDEDYSRGPFSKAKIFPKGSATRGEISLRRVSSAPSSESSSDDFVILKNQRSQRTGTRGSRAMNSMSKSAK